MRFQIFIILPFIQLISASGPAIEPRIYHGKRTTINEMGGFAVQIYIYNTLVCTGCLLSERHVLTAAHCFQAGNPDHFHVIVGETTTKTYFYTDNIKNMVSSILKHPEYNRTAYKADIAVMRMRKPMKGPQLAYASLCSKEPSPNDPVTVAGWGVSEDDKTLSTLRVMEVPLVSMSECNSKMEREMPKNVICAGGYNKRTICRGDSGGPLISNGELCGISIWTYECGNTVIPDVYMSVYYYRDFIKKAMKKLGF